MAGPLMIVDDSQSSLTVMKLVLEKSGIEQIQEFSCAQSALNSIKEGNIPAFIISDFRMPVMNGLEFLDKVSELYPEIPSLIISGDKASVLALSQNYPVVEKGEADFFKQLADMITNHFAGCREELQTPMPLPRKFRS